MPTINTAINKNHIHIHLDKPKTKKRKHKKKTYKKKVNDLPLTSYSLGIPPNPISITNKPEYDMRPFSQQIPISNSELLNQTNRSQPFYVSPAREHFNNQISEPVSIKPDLDLSTVSSNMSYNDEHDLNTPDTTQPYHVNIRDLNDNVVFTNQIPEEEPRVFTSDGSEQYYRLYKDIHNNGRMKKDGLKNIKDNIDSTDLNPENKNLLKSSATNKYYRDIANKEKILINKRKEKALYAMKKVFKDSNVVSSPELKKISIRKNDTI